MELAQIIKLLILFIIAVYCLVVLINAAIFFNLKKKYGKLNAKRLFLQEFKLPPFIPAAGSKKYKTRDSLLLSAGINMRLEAVYALKYTAFAGMLLIALLIHLTNNNIKINLILKNMNLSRNIYEQMEYEEDFIRKELQLIGETRVYLRRINAGEQNVYHTVMDRLEARINELGLAGALETSKETAERIMQKIIKVAELEHDSTPYFFILILAVLSFKTPDFLIIIKMTLVERKRDWEILNCMLVYSTIAALPLCRVETVINCMHDVSRIYKATLDRFANALAHNDNGRETQEILDSIKEDDFQEILETLVIASDVGVGETAENIEDMLENKIKWLEVKAIRNRQMKFAIAVIPVTIVMFLLFMYMMEGINIMNYALQIDLKF